MAANVPIIASDVSACRNLIRRKSWTSCKTKSIKSWEKNLKKLMEDSSYRKNKSEKLADLVKVYDSKDIALKWEKL